MTIRDQQRARLALEIEPALRRRLQRAARAQKLTIGEYVEAVLRQALMVEEVEEKPMMQPEQLTISQLTVEEQQRGHQVLTELERIRDELAATQGPLAPESWELLNASRAKRTRELSRTSQE